MEERELANIISEILDAKKGIDIQIIDLEGKTIIADYFVIATGNSKPHIRSLTEEVEIKLRDEYKIEPLHIEGRDSGRWILMDYGGVILHVFHEEDRNFYSLEKLWQSRRI
ncbi:MAG: ribosome silencing factor [Eubacteriales bacterium]|nr:ribosome silencing factor [Eubacteriales bacterium]MDD4328300.1 ribosome silencing factor [Eubacteriales bacterium]MDD4717351.1 ribosome silencing factor [Eubacteriales bacterium]